MEEDYRDILACARPILHHRPMEIAHRAKQFAPFAALKGYEDTVQRQEVIYAERPLLSEDRKEELNRRLMECKPGDHVIIERFAENPATWRRRITESPGEEPEERILLYEHMRQREASEETLGCVLRTEGRLRAWLPGGRILLEDGSEIDAGDVVNLFVE